MAWNFGGNGTTVLRGAYATYIDRFYQLFNTNNVTNIPFATASDGTQVRFRLRQPVGVDAFLRVQAVDPQFRNPFTSIGRNAFNSKAVYVYDTSLMKKVALTERLALSLEANIFNLFNRAQLGSPVASLSNARFGEITSSRPGFTPRQFQFGAKVTF